MIIRRFSTSTIPCAKGRTSDIRHQSGMYHNTSTVATNGEILSLVYGVRISDLDMYFISFIPYGPPTRHSDNSTSLLVDRGLFHFHFRSDSLSIRHSGAHWKALLIRCVGYQVIELRPQILLTSLPWRPPDAGMAVHTIG